MAKLKTATQSARLNYRPSTEKMDAKGTKPTTDPTSVKEIMTLMILFVCKKIVFYNTNYKVYIYLGTLFLISLVSDVGSVPKSYLSRSDNIFNHYFVKWAWAWNIILLVPYVSLTSYIYCCGEKDKMFKHHLSRVFIATFFWWFWTNFFSIIENTYGKCVKNDQFSSKQSCLKAGYFWNGFDISGHAFILIYGNLVLIEETRSIVNWDSIKDYIRLENHYRGANDQSYSSNPLKSLPHQQFVFLLNNYEKHTPRIRILFIVITMLNVLWDFMLLCTMLYYHVMVEKLLGGLAAIITWYITYRIWYPSNYLPKMPGDGVFKYIKPTRPTQPPAAKRRTGSIVNGTQTFMGRPLYPNRSGEGNATDGEETATTR